MPWLPSPAPNTRSSHWEATRWPTTTLTGKRREILEFIEQPMRERGYPPSVREIGEAVGLTSPSTVHTHLATLQRLGFLRRDPTKPRAIEVRFDPTSGAAGRAPARSATCPLVGDVAAGTDVLAQENVEEILPLPGRLHRRRRAVHAAGPGRLDDRRRHPRRRLRRGRASRPTADKGDIVVAGIPGDEATVKTFTRKGGKVVLLPANARLYARWSSTRPTSRSSARSSPCCAASEGD